MSNSTTLLDSISTNQANKEVVANALFDAASPAMLWGRRAITCNGLTWGYYGGNYQVGSTANTIANGTITLTANATNYVYASATTGAVAVSTTGVPAGAIALYSITTNATSVTGYTDLRSYAPAGLSGTVTSAVNEGTGVSVLDTANSTTQTLKFKSLVAGSGVTLTDNGNGGITIAGGGGTGTVTGGANEGPGVGVLDTANSTATTLAYKSLVAGANVTVTDNGTSGIAIATTSSTSGAPNVAAEGTTIVSAVGTLNFRGPKVTNAGNGQADIELYPAFGSNDTVPPAATSFTWQNQGTATVTQSIWGFTLFKPKSSGDNLSALLIPVPATPYKILYRMRIQPLAFSPQVAGPVWFDSASGRFQTAGPCNNGGAFNHRVQNWSSATGWSGDQVSSLNCTILPEWMRLRDDGSNRYYDVSSDGITWVTLASFARTGYLTPTHVGLCVNPNGGDLMASLHSWYAGA